MTALSVARLLADQEQVLPDNPSAVRVAFALSDDPKCVVNLIHAMKRYQMCDDAQTIESATHDPLIRELLRELLLESASGPIGQLAINIRMLQCVDKSQIRLGQRTGPVDWISRYPPTLRPALLRLCRMSENPESAASEILDNDFPLPEKIAEEIRFLKRRIQFSSEPKITTDNLRRRLHSLNDRLVAPRVPSDARLKHLAEKLGERGRFELCQRVRSHCQKAVGQRMREIHGHDLSPRIFTPPYHRLLPAILELEGSSRRIGLQLLLTCDQEHKNGQPLANENSRFLESLTDAGIKTDPWLQATRPVRLKAANGDRVTVAFATDSLEALMMGFYFETCLSPNDFNFYSAVSNTVDINKQILYCRNKKKQIVGRCLFTLTSEGQIQTYRRYCHNAKLGFAEIVDRYAQRLASAMGTSVTSGKDVQPLVSRSWYDDGAVTMGLGPTEDDTSPEPLVQLVKHAHPDHVVNRLVSLFGTRMIVRANLSMILDEVQSQGAARLMQPIAESLALDPQTPNPIKLRIAMMIRKLGAHQDGQTIDAPTLCRRIVQTIPTKSRALRRFRETDRDGDMRSWTAC